MVQGAGCRVQGVGCRVQGVGFRVWGAALIKVVGPKNHDVRATSTVRSSPSLSLSSLDLIDTNVYEPYIRALYRSIQILFGA